VYQSTNAGGMWVIAGDFPTNDPENGRISIAIAASAPQTLYAAVAQDADTDMPADPNEGNLYRMMRTTNGGTNWTQLGATPEYMNGIGWYANTIIVNPADANTVFAGGGGESIIETTNGGGAWTDISQTGTANPGPHADQHALAFNANGILLDGT